MPPCRTVGKRTSHYQVTLHKLLMLAAKKKKKKEKKASCPDHLFVLNDHQHLRQYPFSQYKFIKTILLYQYTVISYSPREHFFSLCPFLADKDRMQVITAGAKEIQPSLSSIILNDHQHPRDYPYSQHKVIVKILLYQYPAIARQSKRALFLTLHSPCFQARLYEF